MQFILLKIEYFDKMIKFAFLRGLITIFSKKVKKNKPQRVYLIRGRKA